jgi:nitroimidazol reductase NimA-like FMN-containing flavoprotein (pyridoxamine 5'-phosphate oxidase superfamily)
VGRESIEMSDVELRAFLAGVRQVVVGLLGSDGEPLGALARCALVEDQLVFVLSDGRLCALVERDPRVCCATDEYPTYYQIRGMTAHGRARRVQRPSALEALEGVAYAIDLEDVVSFDFAKIQAQV